MAESNQHAGTEKKEIDFFFGIFFAWLSATFQLRLTRKKRLYSFLIIFRLAERQLIAKTDNKD